MCSCDIEVVDGAAVGDHQAVKSPPAPEYVLEQELAAAAGATVITVVCTHELTHAGLGCKCLECRQIGLPEISLADSHVELVPVPFRSAVHREMLRARVGLVIVGIVSLEPPDHGHAHPGREERVLSVGFLTAAPARVPEYVYVRSPEGQSVILLPYVLAYGVVVLRARLVGDEGESLLETLRVKGGRHSYRLRVHCRQAGPRDSVQSLVPPVIGRYAETFYRLGTVHHHSDLLLQGEPREQVFDTLFPWKFRVEIGKHLGVGARHSHHQGRGCGEQFNPLHSVQC